jgi:hypothetical protein
LYSCMTLAVLVFGVFFFILLTRPCACLGYMFFRRA